MKPSDHLKAGQCPMCHGTGKAGDMILYMDDPTVEDRLGICPMCHGTAAWPPPEGEDDD